MKKQVICGVSVLLALVLASSAMAVPTPLNPVATAYKPSTTPALPTPSYQPTLPTYCVLANQVANLVSPLAGGISGTVESWVYYDPATGDAATGEKTFVYQFIHTGGPAVARASMGGGYWNNVNITDCGADHSGTSRTAANAPNWTDGDPAYLERLSDWGIGMQFLAQGQTGNDLLSPSGTSSRIFFETEYNSYALASASVIDGGQSADGVAYAPKQYSDRIPEPSGLAVLASGLLGLVAAKRRK